MKFFVNGLPIAGLLALLAFQISFASNWPCDGNGIMNCDSPPEGDICGSDEDDIYQLCVGGEENVMADLYTCNGRNDNCGGQEQLCNVVVRYVVMASEVFCCEPIVCLSLSASRDNEDCFFKGWCVNSDLNLVEVLNRKCNGDPCAGPFPSPMPSTEPAIRQPGYAGGFGWSPEHIPAVP